MLMPFWAVILFSVKLADISLSFDRCVGFDFFASVTEPKDSPMAGSSDYLLQFRACLMNFNSRKLTLIPKFERRLNWLDGVAIVITSVGTIAEWLAFRDELRRKKHRSHREILAVPGDHCFGDLGHLDEERVLRPVFFTEFRLPCRC